jgi:hypothetical protein
MAKLRIFAEACVAIAPRMKLKWLVCKLRETKVLISHNVQRSPFRTFNGPLVRLSLDGVADRSVVALDASKRNLSSLKEVATKAGLPGSEPPSEEIWDRDLRNAIFHSDYSVHGTEVGVLSAEGTSSNRLFRVQTPSQPVGFGP